MPSKSMYPSSLKGRYNSEIRQKLKEKLGLKNIMQVPRLSKVVLNVGVKRSVGDSKMFKLVSEALGAIAGQTPKKTRARLSIASFKIREGMDVGVFVTLRGDVMYHFVDKLIRISLPRVRDFQGVSTKFDRFGNYNLGIKSAPDIFPETDDISETFGMNISFHTTALNGEQGYALLQELGMPFKKTVGR